MYIYIYIYTYVSLSIYICTYVHIKTWQIYAHGLHGYVGASARGAPLREYMCSP